MASDKPASSPSYLQPTVASRSKKDTLDQPRKPSKPARRSSHGRRDSRSNFACYRLSTKASRAKACWPGPFRFFDLPPELRDLIYEFAGLVAARKIDLDQHELPSTFFKHLPPILHASKQLRYEAGAHFFSASSFDFLLDRGHLSLFFSFLNEIGRLNCERLLSNPNVTIHFEHSFWYCGRTCPHPVNPNNDVLSGAEALYVTGLTNDYKFKSGSPRLELKISHWGFPAVCQFARRDWRFDHSKKAYRFNERNEFSNFQISDIVDLRRVLMGILLVAQGKKVNIKDTTHPNTWLSIDQTDQGMDTIILPTSVRGRGRILYVRRNT